MSLGYNCTKGYRNKKIHICGICSLCFLLQLRKIHSSRDNNDMLRCDFYRKKKDSQQFHEIRIFIFILKRFPIIL